MYVYCLPVPSMSVSRPTRFKLWLRLKGGSHVHSMLFCFMWNICAAFPDRNRTLGWGSRNVAERKLGGSAVWQQRNKMPCHSMARGITARHRLETRPAPARPCWPCARCAGGCTGRASDQSNPVAPARPSSVRRSQTRSPSRPAAPCKCGTTLESRPARQAARCVGQRAAGVRVRLSRAAAAATGEKPW